MTPPIGSTTIGPGIRERGALEQARAWLAALQVRDLGDISLLLGGQGDSLVISVRNDTVLLSF